MEDKAKCGHPLYWYGCYRGTYDLINAESFAHPAKMSPSLCFRILEHLKELGLLKENDIVLDPMAGTGMTNLCAGAMGYKSVSVELEEKFVKFQKHNKEYAERRLYKPLAWQIIQGDSRRLSELVDKGGLKGVTSPPYTDLVGNYSHERGDPQKYLERQERYNEKVLKEKGIKRPAVAQYSVDKANIGNLVDTPLKSIVSPPYENSQGHPSLGSVNKDDWGKEGKDIIKRRGLSGEYGEAEGQVGNLKSITSPPYEESLPNGLDRKAAEVMVQAMYDKYGRSYSKEDFEYQVELILKRSNREYGDTDGQIGKLKDKPLKAITSPPYEQSIIGGKSGIKWQEDWGKPSETRQPSQDISYGDSKENIGNLKDTPLKSIVSPPYAEAQSGGGIAKKGYTGLKHSPTDLVGNRSYMPEVHGQSEGQIANLKDTPLKAIVSPPYEGGGHHKGMLDSWGGKKTPVSGDSAGSHGYGSTKGQIEDAESYLGAMEKVYSEIAKVSDVLCVVVKNPTRNGKLRRLDLDTIRILELSGWKIHCQHRALLFVELEQANLFEGSKKQVKGRLSFFKRLSWQNGQPVANWEDIIIAIRK